MNYLSVDLFYDFECIANSCPNTCCAGWAIQIDKETYKKMEENEQLLGIPAQDWLIKDNDTHYAKMNNGRCCMLNNDNLCKVVLTLGPDYLSNTCSLYPRILREFGNITEIYLNMSCPDVIAKLMDKEKVEFDFATDDATTIFYAYTSLYLYQSSVRTSIMDIIYFSSDYSLATKLYVSYDILNKALSLYQNETIDFNLLQTDIKHYYQDDIMLSLDSRLNGIVKEENRYQILQQIQAILIHYTGHTHFSDLAQQVHQYFYRNDYEQYLTDLNAFREAIKPYNNFHANYWVYRIFAELISIPDYLQVREKFIYIASEFCLIQTVALVSFVQKGVLDRDEYIYITSIISRMLEHAEEIRKQLTEQLKQNNLISTAGLLLLVT